MDSADTDNEESTPMDLLVRERTLTSLQDAYERLQQRPIPSEPQEFYRQLCEKLRAGLTRVCLSQLADARVRFCFYYPQDRQARAFFKALQVRERGRRVGGEVSMGAVTLNPSLLELNLKDNGLQSETKLRSLSGLLEEHGMIARLILSRNPLSPSAFAVLHGCLRLGTSLVSLKLNRCDLTDSEGALLGDFLSRDKQLEHLDIGGNRLGARTAAALSTALRSNHYLVDLGLSWNNFNSADFVTLAEGLAVNTELRRLDCSSNGVEDRGLAALLEAAAAPESRVRVLELDSCRITHLSTEALARFLASSQGARLHAVKLNGNPLFREWDLLRLLEAVAQLAPGESQLALLEMNSLKRTEAITRATPQRLRLRLQAENRVKVRMINADL